MPDIVSPRMRFFKPIITPGSTAKVNQLFERKFESVGYHVFPTNLNYRKDEEKTLK